MTTIQELAADERTARIILAIASEPGDQVTGMMLRTLGATETVENALAETHPPGPGGDTWQRRLAPRINADHIQRVLEDTSRHDLRVLIPGDPEWPSGVDALGDRAPSALWVKGDPKPLAAPHWDRLGITGARAATGYGVHVTGEIAGEAVVDFRQVISGGAYGVDSAAHRAALDAAGTTVAVMAGGLDRHYPAGNADLFQRIERDGVLVSELPPGAAPTRWRFMQRGRLIAALSGAVVVTEAGVRSGALHTASSAINLQRPVGAVPGPVTSAASAGCHRLMRDGLASLVATYEDARELLSSVRDGAQHTVRVRAGLENDALDPIEVSDQPPHRGLSL
ncbi:DNA-processing protein DprA [Leucobacter chromiireducens]|uniref:DNA-protecting protein DprA n=1 Tax=Leucobacter chromiireducens subsp. chromiireducens TaxID=660067 RepID=A0ABS1SV21_9MICO|nr:DNA-processing protein DprA [Leucobacter chromiireducens]MBL3691022.1 DNA-protecting protein DprA [Leucobacter chromiireducens subsp. chromiireducens]